MPARLSSQAPSRSKRKSFGFIPTLSDVAAHAGVAVSTASAVLNGKSYCSVSDDTRKRIFAACEKLGYKANPMAKAMHRQATHTIGLIMPRIISSGILADQLQVLDNEIRKAGYTAVLSTHQYDTAAEVTQIRDQIARAIDGIILYPSGQFGREIKELIDSRFPLVTISTNLPVHTFNVTVNRFMGGYLQMQHLLSRGRKKPLVLMPHNASTTGLAKHHGRRRALEEAGRNPDDLLTQPMDVYTGDHMHDGANAMAEALDRKLDFDCVIANADIVALGAISTLHARGVRIPEDVAIIGFDDDAYAAYLTPSLTTIRQSRQLGQAAFGLLMRQIEAQNQGARIEPEEINLEPELIVRQST